MKKPNRYLTHVNNSKKNYLMYSQLFVYIGMIIVAFICLFSHFKITLEKTIDLVKFPPLRIF